jgi:hypothetical protein
MLLTDFSPEKKSGLGPGCGPKPKPKTNSEFNSIHFGKEINRCLDTQKCLGLKISEFFQNS